MTNQDFSPALFTDLYQLTMAQAYWESGTTARATFSLFFRSYPPDRAYFVLAGVQDVLEFLESFHFSDSDVGHLESLGTFKQGFLRFISGLRFTGSVRAMDEGAIFFANEPVLEVTAPIVEAQIVETFLINQINLQSILATKASRVVHAARGKTVVDFAARRTHGVDAAGKMARAGYIVGFAGTSNLLAGRLYGIPLFGTMAHSFVQAFATEEESFRAYARSFPESTTLLVDTIDTLEGVGKAAAVAKEMRQRGHSLRAIRLDSGDLLELSIKSRAMLDQAGLGDTQIFASGGLDEFEIESLLNAGAPIDGFGVGTRVGVSADAPWTDCAYKLVEYDDRPTLKLSSGKRTAPGRKQVFRYGGADGAYLRDTIGLADERRVDEGEELLGEAMTHGRRVRQAEDLGQVRKRFVREFSRLPHEHKVLKSPATYRVAVSEKLNGLQQALVEEKHGRNDRT